MVKPPYKADGMRLLYAGNPRVVKVARSAAIRANGRWQNRLAQPFLSQFVAVGRRTE